MVNVKTYNNIASVGINQLDDTYYNVGDNVNDPDAILVRSAKLHDIEFNKELKAIARCGAGYNNIPVDRCSENGIVVFNTPGANANGVKELTICALLLASRKIVSGIEWAKTLKENVAQQVEKGKSAFVGCEIEGKTLGVVGLGNVGGLVANAANKLGMKVIGCDPYITIAAAWELSHSVQKASSYEELYKQSDYITLHVPSLDSTRGMINKKTIEMMKDGVKIINLARGDLVNSDDIIEALDSGKISCYITDFPDEKVINHKNVVAIPHLGEIGRAHV